MVLETHFDQVFKSGLVFSVLEQRTRERVQQIFTWINLQSVFLTGSPTLKIDIGTGYILSPEDNNNYYDYETLVSFDMNNGLSIQMVEIPRTRGIYPHVRKC